MAIFITGASGFIGQALTRKLIQKGAHVRILIRNPQIKYPSEFQKAEFVTGDLSQSQRLSDAIKGCTQVYHLAALARAWAKDPREFDRANIEGTENVLKAAFRAEVQRVVHTSTVMAIGPADNAILDERAPFPSRIISHYQRTKIEAEKKVQNYVNQGLSLTIASPSLVYGPGTGIRSNSFNRMLLDFLKGKPVFVPGNGSQSLNMVFIDDVVEGLIRVMERGRNGDRYILGGENIRVNDLEKVIQEVTGLPYRVHHIPFWVARMAGLIEQIRALLMGNAPRLTWKAIEAYKSSWAYSSGKAIRELGYRPRSLRDGIARTCDWIMTREKPGR